MLTIKFTRSGVSGIGRRVLQEVGRAAMLAVGYYWWKNFLPLHFMRTAIQRYGYTPRAGDFGSGVPFKGSYTEGKVRGRANGAGVRSIKENKPFVWSGRSREQATSTPNITATAKNFQTYTCHVNIPANTLNFLRGRINADKEIRATTPDEERILEQVFADTYEAELNRHGRTLKTTKTIAA